MEVVSVQLQQWLFLDLSFVTITKTLVFWAKNGPFSTFLQESERLSADLFEFP
jgi:hypothetical protein